MVAFGDSEFAMNKYFKTYGNGDLIVNAVDWAAGQENLINLTPKAQTQRMLVPPFSLSITANVLFLGLVVGLPGAIIFLGIIAWFARRRRG
jgi:ABC-type uncharacterized transport system involved in gliding motility auxiliary subunit